MNLNPISNPPFQTIQPEFIAQLQKAAGGDNGFLSEFQFILLLVPFFEAHDACKAVNAILQAGVMPSCLEFMERNAIDYAIRYCGEAFFPIKDGVV